MRSTCLRRLVRQLSSTPLVTGKLSAGTMKEKSGRGSSRSVTLYSEGRNQPKRNINSPPWEGPYMVTEVIWPGAYRQKDDNGNVLTNTWNI